jgi:hypothetical protein
MVLKEGILNRSGPFAQTISSSERPFFKYVALDFLCRFSLSFPAPLDEAHTSKGRDE